MIRLISSLAMSTVKSSKSSSPSTIPLDKMTASPSRTATLLSNLASVTSLVASATAVAPTESSTSRTKPVRLVAVSKLKPISDILALHNPPACHFHFGENYLQELLQKSCLLPSSVKWHFIGGLQSNKCVTLARDVPGLWAVESVDTEKKATLLDKGWGERTLGGEDRLRVFIQVNTSGEESKSGVKPSDALTLCHFVQKQCPRLRLQGLMTIGAIARSRATTPETENDDFICLRETRDRAAKELGLEGEDTLELSMGMSGDFEGAIALGSDEVRVGTTIFGERPPKPQAEIAA